MATIYGNIVQEAIYRTFLETFGTDGLVQLLIDFGQTPTSARRYVQLMRIYWDRSENLTGRRGSTYFEPMLYRLIFKPPATPPTGDYSYADGYPFVAGGACLDAVLDEEPAFQELYKKTGEPFYEVLDYIYGIPLGVTVFVAIVENVWSAYIGETDTPVPDVCG